MDLYRQLGELLGKNRTKIELKIEPKLTFGNKNIRLQSHAQKGELSNSELDMYIIYTIIFLESD